MSTCWPARWPVQSGTSSTSVTTRAVSAITSRTSAVIHCRRFGRAAGSASIAGIALLKPRIAIDVITELFPEAGPVIAGEFQAAHPFGALPEIQMRHQQPSRTAMFGGERL